MCDNVDTYTPKAKCRSLGLKRGIQKVHKTPLSDVKVDYSSLQRNLASTASPSTPCGSQSLVGRTTASTNGRPYCLSLSRRIREKYKKKKLEFTAAAKEAENDQVQHHVSCEQLAQVVGPIGENVDSQPDHPRTTETEFSSQEQCDSNIELLPQNQEESPPSDDEETLLKEIAAHEELLKSHQKHQETVRELQTSIDTWKTAFNDALSELSSKTEPKMQPEDLLSHLGIPPEMTTYIDT